MPNQIGLLKRGKSNILNLASLGFLVLTLVVITATTSNPLKKQLTGAYARYSAEATINRRERAAARGEGPQCKGAGCLAPEIIANRDNPNNQTGEAAKIIETYDQATTGNQTALEKLKNYNAGVAAEVQKQIESQPPAPAPAAPQITAKTNADCGVGFIAEEEVCRRVNPQPGQSSIVDYKNIVFYRVATGNIATSTQTSPTANANLKAAAEICAQTPGATCTTAVDIINFSLEQLKNQTQDTTLYQKALSTQEAVAATQKRTAEIQAQVQAKKIKIAADNNPQAIAALFRYKEHSGNITYTSEEQKAVENFCIALYGNDFSKCGSVTTFSRNYLALNPVTVTTPAGEKVQIPAPDLTAQISPSDLPVIAASIPQNYIAQNPSLLNFAYCQDKYANDPKSLTECNTKLTGAQKGLSSFPGFTSYVTSFQKPYTNWQAAGFKSVDEYITNCVNKKGGNQLDTFACTKEATDYTPEAKASSIQLGTNLTAAGSFIYTGAGGIAELAGGAALKTVAGEVLTQSLAIQAQASTGNAAATCTVDSGSGKCIEEVSLAALSWANIGAYDYVKSATSLGTQQALQNARIINASVSTLNAGFTGYQATQNCFGENYSALGCVLNSTFTIAATYVGASELNALYQNRTIMNAAKSEEALARIFTPTSTKTPTQTTSTALEELLALGSKTSPSAPVPTELIADTKTAADSYLQGLQNDLGSLARLGQSPFDYGFPIPNESASFIPSSEVAKSRLSQIIDAGRAPSIQNLKSLELPAGLSLSEQAAAEELINSKVAVAAPEIKNPLAKVWDDTKNFFVESWNKIVSAPEKGGGVNLTGAPEGLANRVEQVKPGLLGKIQDSTNNFATKYIKDDRGWLPWLRSPPTTPITKSEEVLASNAQKLDKITQKVNSILEKNFANGGTSPGCRGGLCLTSSDYTAIAAKQQGFKAAEYQVEDLNLARGILAKKSFGHAVTIAEDENGNKYLIDLTFNQFIDPQTGIIRQSISRGITVGPAKDYPIAQELLSKGYVKLTDETLNEYLRITSSPEFQPTATLNIIDRVKPYQALNFTPQEIARYAPDLAEFRYQPTTTPSEAQSPVAKAWNNIKNFLSGSSKTTTANLGKIAENTSTAIKNWFGETKETIYAKLKILSPEQRAANEEFARDVNKQVAIKEQQARELEARLSKATGVSPFAEEAKTSIVESPGLPESNVYKDIQKSLSENKAPTLYDDRGAAIKITGKPIAVGGQSAIYPGVYFNGTEVAIKIPINTASERAIVSEFDLVGRLRQALIEADRVDLVDRVINPISTVSVSINGNTIDGYAMPLLTGDNMFTFLESGRPVILSADDIQAFRDMAKIWDGKGIPFGDLGPSNFVYENGRWVLFDPAPGELTGKLGLARSVPIENAQLPDYIANKNAFTVSVDGKQAIYGINLNNEQAFNDMLSNFRVTEANQLPKAAPPATTKITDRINQIWNRFKTFLITPSPTERGGEIKLNIDLGEKSPPAKPGIYSPKGDPVIEGSQVRVNADGTAEIKTNLKISPQGDTFVPLENERSIPGIAGGQVLKAQDNFYYISDINGGYKVTLLTGEEIKPNLLQKAASAINDNRSASKALNELLASGTRPSGYEDAARLLIKNGYDYRDINTKTVTKFVDDFYRAYYAKNPSLTPPYYTKITKIIQIAGGVGYGFLGGELGVELYANRDAIISYFRNLGQPGYYSPFLKTRILLKDGKWYRADNNEDISDQINASYLVGTTQRNLEGLAGIIAVQHATIDQSTFESPEWKAFSANILNETSLNPYDINAITKVVNQNMAYNFKGLNAGAIFYATTDRTLQNVLNKNLNICFEFAVAEQAYLAQLGIPSELAHGSLDFNDGTGRGGHMFLIITDKNGKKWIADPTAGEVKSYNDYITDYKVEDLGTVTSIYKFTNPEKAPNFTIGQETPATNPVSSLIGTFIGPTPPPPEQQQPNVVSINDHVEKTQTLSKGAAEYVKYNSTSAPGVNYHVVVVDLNHAQIVVDNPYSVESTSNFLIKNNVDIAINGDGYHQAVDPKTGQLAVKTAGSSIVNGVLYKGWGYEQSVYFDKDNKVIMNSDYTLPGKPPANAYNSISFPNLLVDGGQALPITSSDTGVNSRTALGITKGGKLILITVDGKQYANGLGYEGMTIPDVQRLLIEQGAVIGINLDGGGSTTMVGRDENGNPIILDNPDGSGTQNQNSVANHFGIRILP